MDGADLELFERSLSHATEVHTGPDLDAALTELGWADALRLDPQAAVALLFELQGAANATSSALDLVVASVLGPSDANDSPGATRVLLPALGRWAPPGVVDEDGVTVHGVGTAALAEAASVLIVVATPDGEVALEVPRAQLDLRRVHGIDPWLGVMEVTARSVDVVPGSPVAGWTDAVALGQVAVGHELVGAARRMLELAREHALDRVQFGRPISEFQAIRHRLADTLVAIETADAVLAAAWLDRSPATAAMAKALAGRGARTAARHCQQVLAGIGFTTEHRLHRYVRRVLVLDELLGSAATLTRALGDEVLTTRQLPPLLPL